jgi:Cu-Zn family superoxide dismutase
MTKTNATAILGFLIFLGASIGVGCNSSSSDSGMMMIASSAGATLMPYPDPYAPAMAGTPNPITGAATASATAWNVGGKLKLELKVTGMPAMRTFGAHLHRLACTDTKAGGHYQQSPWPTNTDASSPTDPTYANVMNEVWLDFTTDASGNASFTRTVDWLPRAGEAKGIIIHHMATGTGGAAGARLACLPIAF